MTAPALSDHQPPCAPEVHRHDPLPPRPQGGRCAFFSPGRPGDICGRPPTAVYVNPRARVRRTYRCHLHDREVAVREAARLGFRREAVARA